MQTVTINDLRSIVALKNLPVEHLQWLLDRSEYNEYEDGTQIVKLGDPADTMWMTLEGRVTFYMDVNGRQVYYFSFRNDTETGGVGGLLPYSRMKTSPGYAYADGFVRSVSINKKYFPELEQLNPDLIQILIGYMTERARTFATTQLQHEKVNALGNLAAGIAHELNNPAAAINRISNELSKRLTRNFELTEKLLRNNVSPQHIQSISELVEKKKNSQDKNSKISTLKRMEMEDEIFDWLEGVGFANREAAETFSEYGLTIEEFEQLNKNVGIGEFPVLLSWLDNLLSSHNIIKDLDDASSRISSLVGAIKSHVHMDRTNDLQSTNIQLDIENSLTLLGFKLSEKNIQIVRKYCDDMPVVPAYIGELNQVWTNLIDNAIFALPKNGELKVEISCDSKNIKVCIIDNGSGIPKEIISRIFDPFFTTKKVGEGTGIGLDLVNRIIKHHNGEIKVNSIPGRTEFSVCIPVKQEQKSLEPIH